MRRIWLTLMALVSLNACLLSGCPAGVTPQGQQAGHEGGGGGGGY